ncbi:hypothetical protein EV356DRAFT_457037, partial [Viridothelium virens]
LYSQCQGYVLPGICTLIPIQQEYIKRSKIGNRWDYGWLALRRTMSLPDNVNWDQETVYKCVFTLLCAMDTHNQTVKASTDAKMTGPQIGLLPKCSADCLE